MEIDKRKTEEFIKAYDDFADGLFRYCYFKISNRERAIEIVQDTFLKAWNSLQSGQDVMNYKSFLYKIANNLIIDEYRKKKSVSLDKMHDDEGFDIRVDEHERSVLGTESKLILTHIGKLDEKYQEVMILRFVNDLTPKEIAVIVDETENTVSVRLNRALQQMRKMLNIS
jgi:RNA polymerase sigma-70 factor, ECF subfamily